MGTDFSRIRLNPLLDYAGVRLKQGGLLLDADANELADVLDRRLRALASDVLDRATVSSTTKDAFKIDVSASPFTIGIGRLYVDGLLAECHGAPNPAKRVFDDLLGEGKFADPVPYNAQPYFPNPPALPTGGRHLVYLDVWDREVTYVEDPELVEIAVGVDASSRVQTVWQVRVLGDDAGDGSCSSPDADLPGWADIIAPSAGVLTTGTFEVAPVDDPCELPPTGGYRGLENQLYRVEIHDASRPGGGGATFKWSRENASIASRVASIVSATELELVSLGRDDLLSFKTGDWVEILDDAREFSQAPGEMRKITVQDATRRIQFTPALPAAMLPGTFPNSAFPAARNLRVRRWEQAGRIFRTDPSGTPVEVQDLDAAGSTGLIEVPAAGVTLLLEDGVTVAFDTTGPEGFHSGDYWVFAARTADASVELLDRAPPRGIHHHYARLGIWDVSAGTITDCRHPWPPKGGEGHDCSCTACVTAESHASGAFTIQDGVNLAAATGGTVCLGPGQYALREPVRMVGIRGVKVRGQGAATMVVAAGTAFLIKRGIAVGVENLTILSLARAPAISVQTAILLSLRQLLIAVIENSDFRASAIALEGAVGDATIADNAILAGTGVLANDARAPKDEGDSQSVFLLSAALRIQDNILWCRRQAVVLDGAVLHLLDTRVTANDILTCSDFAVSALGFGAAGSSFVASRNSLSVAGGGIRCGVDGAWIGENKLVNTARGNAAVGISLATGLDRDGSNQCQVIANQVSGFGIAGILIAAPVLDLIVKMNIISACGGGIVSTADANGGSLSIENNHLRDIDAARESGSPVVVGIGAYRAQSVTIAGNTLRAIALQSPQAVLRAGILTLGVQRARIAGNEIIQLAPPGDFVGRAAGIMLLPAIVDAEVSHNHVERDLVPLTQDSNGQWQALVMLDTVVQPATGLAGAVKTGGFATVKLDAGKTLVLGAGKAFVNAFDFAAVADRPVGPSASVLGNVFNARGDAPAVEIALTQCLFNDNRVDARLNRRKAVTIAAPLVIVDSNRITGEELSLEITEATSKSAAVLGNITTRGIALSGAGLSPPWAALNLNF